MRRLMKEVGFRDGRPVYAGTICAAGSGSGSGDTSWPLTGPRCLIQDTGVVLAGRRVFVSAECVTGTSRRAMMKLVGKIGRSVYAGACCGEPDTCPILLTFTAVQNAASQHWTFTATVLDPTGIYTNDLIDLTGIVTDPNNAVIAGTYTELLSVPNGSPVGVLGDVTATVRRQFDCGPAFPITITLTNLAPSFTSYTVVRLNANQVKFSGVVADEFPNGLAVDVIVNGVNINTVTCAADGSWTYTHTDLGAFAGRSSHANTVDWYGLAASSGNVVVP